MRTICAIDKEHIGALNSSMRVSIPPRRYAIHIALDSSIYEPSSCFEEVRCVALMEDGV
jgi:hypothetical protein